MMEYYHVDVFSSEVLSGNGLAVVFCSKELGNRFMQKVTQEFNQFETIFVIRIGENIFSARIFTVEEELDFAGHPILGAAASIHDKLFNSKEDIEIALKLKNKEVITKSKKMSGHYDVQMNQGKAQFISQVPKEKCGKYLKALNLSEENLSERLPVEVVSTGLPYLLVPLKSGIESAKITCSNFQKMLEEVDAKFAYVFDENHLEARTWDNLGKVEDVATGSAAGPLGAYLYKYGIVNADSEIIINQGQFAGRPSKIKVSINQLKEEILVAGNVAVFAKGVIHCIN